VFCEREASPGRPAWPEWLGAVLRKGPAGSDEGVAEQLENELRKTVDCVCDTCSDGWIRRVESGVSEFLAAMIRGEPTPLPAARRKILARWSAKTAVFMECASGVPVRTPRLAAQRLRTIGVHPGTQVLVGKADGHAEVLGYRQDLFRRTVDGEQRVASQSSLVIGKVLIQVFADPSRDSAPELVEDAAHPFIPLIGNQDQQIVWPGSLEIDHGQGTTMANDDVGSASAAQGVKDPVASTEDNVGAVGERPRKMPPRLLVFGAMALAIVIGLGGLAYGLHERSNANHARSELEPAQLRIKQLVARLGNEQKQLAASVANATVLNRSISTLTSDNAGGTRTFQPLSKIVAAVPAVTDGIRQCSNAALATATEARAYAAEYPHSSTDTLNADSKTADSACRAANQAAFKLEGYVNGP
jgi:hypothetical protein